MKPKKQHKFVVHCLTGKNKQGTTAQNKANIVRKAATLILGKVMTENGKVGLAAVKTNNYFQINHNWNNL